MIEIDGVSKQYGDKTAIKDLFLGIDDERVFGLIGHGERFGINGLRLCCRREQERGEQQGEQPRHAFVLFHHIDIRFKV